MKTTTLGSGDYSWTAFNLPSGATDSGDLDPTGCERDIGPFTYILYEAEDFDSNVLGSWTLTVWDDVTGFLVSNDSFRLIPADAG